MKKREDLGFVNFNDCSLRQHKTFFKEEIGLVMTQKSFRQESDTPKYGPKEVIVREFSDSDDSSYLRYDWAVLKKVQLNSINEM